MKPHRIGALCALLAAGLAFPAQAVPVEYLALDVALFEEVPLDRAGSIIPVAIALDTRCSDPFDCSEPGPGTLVVAVAQKVGNAKRAVLVQMNRPVTIAGGTLTLVGTTTRAKNGRGGIALRDYRLDFLFEPSRQEVLPEGHNALQSQRDEAF